jgi:hypothetical protein
LIYDAWNPKACFNTQNIISTPSPVKHSENYLKTHFHFSVYPGPYVDCVGDAEKSLCYVGEDYDSDDGDCDFEAYFEGDFIKHFTDLDGNSLRSPGRTCIVY